MTSLRALYTFFSHNVYDLTEKIESYTAFKVRQNWLKGMSRTENAIDCGISTGSVSNIMKTFLDSLASYDIESIREFVVHLRKQKISVEECALGYRIHNIVNALGISEDEKKLQIFLKDAHDFCTRLDISPHIIQDILMEMIKISKDILPSQMKSHLQRKIEEKEALEDRLEKIKEEIHKEEEAKYTAEQNFALTKKKIDVTSAELNWYANIKDGLEREGLPVDDITFLCRTVATIKKHTDKEVFEALQKINELENLDKEIESNKRTRAILKTDIATMKDIHSQYSEKLSSEALLLDSLDKIKRLGIDSKDLEILIQVLNKIWSENAYKIGPLEIKQRFFEILSSYGKNLALENKIETLEYLISNLENEVQKNRSILLSQGSTGIILRNLLNKGLNENDIISVKMSLDKSEKNNLTAKNFDVSPSLTQAKSQNMIEANNEFNITSASISTNQFISEDLDPSLEKNKISMIRHTDSDENDDDDFYEEMRHLVQ
ncbi:MAG TPA: hypothetical protein VJ767_02915 [Nitrososphaeraceae archaeon]|nr:hypothetical protein [Nitrososphaeraceae archaeon]